MSPFRHFIENNCVCLCFVYCVVHVCIVYCGVGRVVFTFLSRKKKKNAIRLLYKNIKYALFLSTTGSRIYAQWKQKRENH